MCHKNTGSYSNIQNGRIGNVHSNSSYRPSGTNTDSHTPPFNTTDMTSITRPSNSNNNNTWVRSFSKNPLTKTQEQVLAQGPSFSLVTKQPPIGDYVAAIEKACQQLKQGKAEELKAEVKSILKKHKPPETKHHQIRDQGY